MKYMNFSRSYTYTGVSNLLEDYNIDIEDYELVRAMKVGYIFKYDLEKNQYLSGTSLEDKRYFDYYLNPLGLELVEKTIDKEGFVDFLRSFKRRCLVDLNLAGKRKKLIFEHYNISRESFVFLNIKENDPEEALYFEYNKKQFLALLDKDVDFSYISYKKGDYLQDLDVEIKDSIKVIDRYFTELEEYMEETRSVESLNHSKNYIFKVIFNDLYISMDLLDYKDLKTSISSLKSSYLKALSLNKPLRLKDYLDIDRLRNLLDSYKNIIKYSEK